MARSTNFVFLHGGGQGGWIWDETVAALSLQSDGAARCLALDVPGCGTKRDRDTSATAFGAIVEELAHEIDTSGMKDIILVGHSQAGTIMPSLLAMRPERFARAIYVSCSTPRPGQNVHDSVADIRASAPDSPLAHAFADKALSMRELMRTMFCNDMTREEADRFLDKLEKDAWPESAYTYTDWNYDAPSPVPAAYVQCLQDATLLPDWQIVFAERFGAEQIVRIDAAHQVQNTRPHALAEVLLALSRG